jgi:hypothetical protein
VAGGLGAALFISRFPRKAFGLGFLVLYPLPTPCCMAALGPDQRGDQPMGRPDADPGDRHRRHRRCVPLGIMLALGRRTCRRFGWSA